MRRPVPEARSACVGGGPGGGLAGSVGTAWFNGGGAVPTEFLTYGQWEGHDGVYGTYNGNQTGGGAMGFGPGVMLTNGTSAQDLSRPFATTPLSR